MSAGTLAVVHTDAHGGHGFKAGERGQELAITHGSRREIRI